jgi:hypothetical protein
LTIFSKSNYPNNIYLQIKDLTLALSGQFIPAKSGNASGFPKYPAEGAAANLKKAYRFEIYS